MPNTYVIELPPCKAKPKKARYVGGFGKHVGFAHHLSRARTFTNHASAEEFAKHNKIGKEFTIVNVV